MWIQAVLYSFGSSCKTESVGKGFPINFLKFPVKSWMEIVPLAALQSTLLAVHAEQQTLGFIDLQAGHPLGRGRAALAADSHPKQLRFLSRFPSVVEAAAVVWKLEPSAAGNCQCPCVNNRVTVKALILLVFLWSSLEGKEIWGLVVFGSTIKWKSAF